MTQNTPNEGKKRRKTNNDRSVYGGYIFKVMRQVHQKATGVKISKKGIAAIDGIILDLEQRLAQKSIELAKYQKKSTLSSKHMQTAVKVLLPGELANHAISEGTKAMTRYNNNSKK